ncbi:MAG: hypothetical protein ACE5OR_13830 [bacterium]
MGTEGAKCEAEVSLTISGVERKGKSEGVAAKEVDELRVVADATKKAVDQFYHELNWVINDVIIHTVSHDSAAQQKVVTTLVTLPEFNRPSAGCSVVKASQYRAAAEATLDAVNRILSKYEPDMSLAD